MKPLVSAPLWAMRGAEAISFDLKRPGAGEVLLPLAEQADIVVEGAFGPASQGVSGLIMGRSAPPVRASSIARRPKVQALGRPTGCRRASLLDKRQHA